MRLLTRWFGGLARVLRARSPRVGASVPIRIGWFCPVLALVVTLDLVTAWNAAWNTLTDVPVNAATLAIGLLETGLYFLAATLLWPDGPAACRLVAAFDPLRTLRTIKLKAKCLEWRARCFIGSDALRNATCLC